VISQHLPALQVVLPLAAAPLCALWRRGTVAWVLATAACWLTFLIAIQLLQQVLTTGPLSYAMGGWPVPWGIEYRLDPLNAFMLLIVTGSAAIILSSARLSVARRLRLPPDKQAWFYATWLLCLTGLLGIISTGDAFNLFVFLEISSLSSYTLISSGRDRRALTAAYQYLIMGTIGATFILLGIGYLYVMTGTLNMADLAERLPAVAHTRTIQVAFAFLTVGLGLKLALFPLHLWLPNAYAYGPSVVTAFLAATATKVSVYVLLRFFFTVFGATFAFQTLRLGWVLLPLALLGMISASLTAIFQNNVRRMLAYSSIAQIGYMILGISLVSVTGLTAAIVHLFNHALMKGTLFLALAGVSFRIGSARLENMAGLGRAMPWTMAAFVIGGLSLLGVPLTAGFISKWYVLLATLQRGWWLVTVLVLLTSLLALVYLGRVVETAYFRPLPDGQPVPQEAPWSLLLPTWVLALANLYFGIDTSLSVGVAWRAAEWLLGGGGS
jgi:multicomponent Na+:H+ antiporter subunit D